MMAWRRPIGRANAISSGHWSSGSKSRVMRSMSCFGSTHIQVITIPKKKVGNFVGRESSPVLANMTLDGLERILRQKYPHSGPKALKGMNKQVNLVRYCDDFIITGISREILETAVKPLVTGFLRERGLELSEEKTKITHIEDGFDFLGQHVRKYNGKFLTRPSKKNVKAFLTDIRKVIKENKQATAYGLVATLNPN